MMDNRILILGWNMGRREEVPSWEPCWEPYEGDRPVADPDTKFEDLPIGLPFEL